MIRWKKRERGDKHMVSILKGTIGEIPFLMAEKEETEGTPLPLVIFLHGYTSAKEHNLHFAYSLAEKGLRVILPDALHHGERMSSHSPKSRDYDFWNIVHQGIGDVTTLINWAKENEYVSENGEIAVGGISMGAIMTYGSIVNNPEISAGCALMGTPAHEEFARWQIEKIGKSGHNLPFTTEELEQSYEHIRHYDLTQKLDKLNNRPLFIWHSEVDDVVPYEFANPYVKTLIENNPKSVYMHDKTSGHKVSRPAYLNAVEWIAEHIKAKKETV
ncbi:prolyl oligopeptidase family serine peptidase [Fictibacillus nanhaiensis]|uniref:prolyl oligopeptidase family serine peptidase n=1 Tax=Fictibacillus nanhaiensis TaxID=742169 RepID=UPI001C985FC0|nr:prolyl oligopeptidase family serine peptidase [Fictibacillus nanhaiensis]MBY6036350.1 prolyl oligopeptidase family serine peptidase [Fictibacillus nanhaiensis]